MSFFQMNTYLYENKINIGTAYKLLDRIAQTWLVLNTPAGTDNPLLTTNFEG